LVPNLLLGAADAERLGGRLDVLYSPDAFGHPAVWPTLAREFGIRAGVVWRGLGGEPGQERDLYRWRGPDGRDALVWHLPQAGYESGAALPADGDRLPAAWAAVRAGLVGRAAGKHIPVFVGADHHAAHPDVSRLRDLLAEVEPQSAFRVSRLDEFFQTAAPGAIAGCASDDVARAVDARLTNVEALAREVLRGSVLDLVRHDPDAVRDRATDPQHALVLWNPAARLRGGVVVADVTLFRRDVPVG